MAPTQNGNETGLDAPRVTNGVVFTQFVLGLILHFVLALPFQIGRAHV